MPKRQNPRDRTFNRKTDPASSPSAAAGNRRPPNLCAWCGLALAPMVDRRTKYHHDCYNQHKKAKSRAKWRLQQASLPFDAHAVAAEMLKEKPRLEDAQVHRFLTHDITEATLLNLRLNPGPQEQLQHLLASRGLFADILGGAITQRAVAKLLDVHETQVSRAVSGLRQLALDKQLSHAPLGMDVEAMLHRTPPPTTLSGELDDDLVWAWCEAGADAFFTWEERYCRLPGDKLYLRDPFHREWVVEMLYAIAVGGYLQILAPPRHGKSQLQVHFCTWLICRNPNIRILWVSATADLGKDFVSACAEILETNDQLVVECCTPGMTFAPPKRGQGTTWARGEFTVVNRDAVLVGATMTAIGTGGSILSRNADVIICDDPESTKTVKMPSQRRHTRHWFTQILDSRKEEHTALMVTGSRQHWDDLYGYNLSDSNFRCVVNRAHDINCAKPKHNWKLHTDCVLFPRLRSYRWLLSKMMGADARTGADDEDDANLFDLVYQNIARRSGSHYWTNLMLIPARNTARRLGLEGIPEKDRSLCAGLDPAASGFQAGFLWAFTPTKGTVMPYDDAYMNRLRFQDWSVKRWMVDLENRQGGGIDEAIELFDLWLRMYGCRHWVIEDMAMQKGFTNDPRVKFWEKVNGARIEGFTTGVNKYDPKWGLGSMTRLWTDDVVDLPYGDEKARAKTDLYESQLLSFDGNVDTERSRRKDLHMASWFPQKVARRREKELVAAATAEVEAVNAYAHSSFPNIEGFSTATSAPWREA
ncbi:MAG TPA: hypothetical protein VIV08_02630 [Acidimicrobiia bacterium]